MKKSKKIKMEFLGRLETYKLVQASERSPQPLVDKFLVLMMVVLGIRIGELVHMTKDWVDFTNKMIRIPSHQPCDCAYCIRQMRQMMKRKDISLEDVQKKFWKPKTAASARIIYYDFDSELIRTVTAFFKEYERFPLSSVQTYTHLRRLGMTAKMDTVSPMCLRRTAAIKFANDGMNVKALQKIMGWENIQVASRFADRSGAMLKDELEGLYGNDTKNHPKKISKNRRRKDG